MKSTAGNNKTNGVISVLIAVLIWGSAFTVTKIGVQEIPPFLLAFLRNLVASLALLPFYILQRKKEVKMAPAKLPYKKIVLMGLTGVTIFYSLFNLSLVYTSAATAALIQGMMPVAIALPAVWFLKETLSKRMVLGIVVSVIGVILVGFIGKADADNSLMGNILMVLSVISWAGYTVISRSVNDHDPIIITFLITAIGTAFLIPAVVIELWGRAIPAISWKGWGAVVYLGIFSSALSYFLYNKSLKTLTAAQAGNFLNLDPVIGAVFAIIFLKDTFTAWQIAGGILVLAGLWLSSKTSSTGKGT